LGYLPEGFNLPDILGRLSSRVFEGWRLKEEASVGGNHWIIADASHAQSR
jgi:hypothetical protein